MSSFLEVVYNIIYLLATPYFSHRYDSEEELVSLLFKYLKITRNFFFSATSCTQTATYLLILVIIPSRLIYLIYLTTYFIMNSTPIILRIRFFSFASFMVSITGNLMVDLGCRDQFSIIAGINNRFFDFFCVKSHPNKKGLTS